MAINSTDTKIKTSGDGATLTFSFPFKIFQNTDIVVQKIDKDTDVATTLTLGTDYTVSINTVTEGGTITIDAGETPSADEWVFIYSNLPFTQTVVLPTDGAFREISVSNGMDRLCRLIQQVKERADRAIVQRADITTTEIVMPEPESNKVLGWNAGATALENKAGLDEAIEACETAQTAAETAATNAGTARTGAETAQGLAEAARDTAVSAAEKIPEPEAGDVGKMLVVNAEEDGYAIVVRDSGGDVSGPATNTDNKVPQWDGANSKTLKDGLTVGTAANNLVQLNGDAKLPAVDASLLTNVPGGEAPSGAVIDYAGSSAPAGWLMCDGSAVSQTTYAALYAVIGHTYGADPGGGNFILPNAAQRVTVGKHSSGTFDTLGKTGGAETHQLTVAEMPAHTHTVALKLDASDRQLSSGGNATGVSSNSTTSSSTGSNTAHNNLQPYIVFNKIIKT